MPSHKNFASFVVRPQSEGHLKAVDALLDLAFGPGRFAKASYRLREGVEPVDSLSFVAEHTGAARERLAGSIRYWPVQIGPSADGVTVNALLLGPLVVAPALQSKGVGLALMETSLEAARNQGHALVLLVGDLPYYERVGFSQVPLGQVTLPQPYNPERLLWRALVPGAHDGVAGAMHRPE
ncbi:MAG: GNAT family N-acetyltransferase [Candidatus Phaeomarinobacter sp.]